jgi:hypothetical protein
MHAIHASPTERIDGAQLTPTAARNSALDRDGLVALEEFSIRFDGFIDSHHCL